MPIPTSIDDLSTTAASNSPSGSDSPTEGDNYLRAVQSVVRQVYDEITGKTNEFEVVTEYGAASDGTDQTSTLVTELSARGAGLYVVPYGVKFDPKTLLESMPTNQVLLDLSAINDYSAAGETCKSVGFLSADTDVNDTHFRVGSGHHAVISGSNYGTAGTTSGDERKFSIAWEAGVYSLGSTDKRGYRLAALQQFSKDPSTNEWIWHIRSNAPWDSIEGEYEIWAAGRAIGSAGTVYVVNGDNHYVNASSGTTAAPGPTHTSGTALDGVGGVQWLWLDSSDRSVITVRQKGHVLIGNGTLDETFRHKVDATDSTGHFISEREATGVSKYVRDKLIPTDGAGTPTVQPFLQAEAGVGLRVMKSDASTDVARWNDNGFAADVIAMAFAPSTIASAGTIAPTKRITVVSGTATISTITPPAAIASTGGEFILVASGAWTVDTAGNVSAAVTAVSGKHYRFVYEPGIAKCVPAG